MQRLHVLDYCPYVLNQGIDRNISLSCGVSIIVPIAYVIGKSFYFFVLHFQRTENFKYFFLRNFAEIVNACMVLNIRFIFFSIVSIDGVKEIFHSIRICLKGMVNAIVGVTHKNEVCIEKRDLIVTFLIIIYDCLL